jgi:hypothetical protein
LQPARNSSSIVTFYLFYNYDYCIANNFQERWWTFFSEFKIIIKKVCWGFSWNLALGLISENKKILCKLYKFPCFFFSCMCYIFIFYNYNYCIANNLQERILFLWKEVWMFLERSSLHSFQNQSLNLLTKTLNREY